MSTAELTMKQKSDAQKDIVQAIAVKRVVKHFKSNDRGQIAMFCGTGKTRTAIKAIKRLKSRVVVVCVPTLGLASQWINDFAEHGEDREVLAVCSRMNSELPEDYGIIGYTTDKSIVRDFAMRKGKLLIVSTYQSYDVVQEAWKRTKIAPIDLLIADEAHNTAGKNSKHMGLCLHDRGAKVSKRLFMTATRRLYRGDKDEYNCMDDADVYGDVVYELPLRDAIDRGIVSDYEVYVINVYKDLRPEDFAKINQRGFESEVLAKFVAEKIMSDKTVRVFTFHNRVDDATEFAQQVASHGKWARVITGEHKVKDREATLREFESHSVSSLTASVNCLGEGIDVPSVDVVIFNDKMTEPQSIIQRIGRGTRIVNGKKKLRIIIPVYVAPKMSDADVNQVADESRHKDALNVIRALASYDPKFYRKVADLDRKLRGEAKAEGINPSESRDNMLQFYGVNPEVFDARLLPRVKWPSYEEGLSCIENAVLCYISNTGRQPSSKSGVYLCPELFTSWRSAVGFLEQIAGESLVDMKLRIMGVEKTNKWDESWFRVAVDDYVKRHGVYPLAKSPGKPLCNVKTWASFDSLCRRLSPYGGLSLTINVLYERSPSRMRWPTDRNKFIAVFASVLLREKSKKSKEYLSARYHCYKMGWDLSEIVRSVCPDIPQRHKWPKQMSELMVYIKSISDSRPRNGSVLYYQISNMCRSRSIILKELLDEIYGSEVIPFDLDGFLKYVRNASLDKQDCSRRFYNRIKALSDRRGFKIKDVLSKSIK